MSARDDRSEREERSGREGFGIRDVAMAVGAVAGLAATAAVALNAIRRDREMDVEVELEPRRGEMSDGSGMRASRGTGDVEGGSEMRAGGSRRGSGPEEESTGRARRPRSIDGNTDRGGMS